ncbi:hypothetical protein Dcar01_00653 [Deinococcus carri]|uniref:Uncharacterized protein n=1 Tax=Deinococcus carri TaxID=1211323 RepID=A0ABP9W3K8_9DEIO
MKPWLLPLLVSPPFVLSVALAGGAQPPALPKLGLNAATMGRVADIQTVPRVPRADGPSFFFPTHVRAILNRPGQHWRPQYDTDLPQAYVAIYPVAGLLAQYPERGEPWNVRTQIDTLKALNSGSLKPGEVGAWGLPYLPLWNAHQVTAGAVRTLETPALKGIRYLTLYSQEGGVRFPREAIFSTFQGLSRDGRFYITVQVPYAPASLPTRAELERTRTFEIAPYPGQSSGPVADAWRKKVDAYNLDLKRKLNAEDNAPALRTLDALVRSIRLTHP